MPAAIRLTDCNGKRAYRFPVRVRVNQPLGTLSDWLNPATGMTTVIAHTAAQAADWARERFATVANTEIEVYGPKGGIAAKRFIGFESAIWGEMCAERPRGEQLALFAS
jgi:nicotinamidase-related amidase